MFENLIESSSKGSKSFGQSVLSLIIHGVVIFAAIEATKGAAEEIKQRVIDTTLVFLKPPEPTPPPPPPPPRTWWCPRIRRPRDSRRWCRLTSSRRTFRRST